jgi:hypothetical protein
MTDSRGKFNQDINVLLSRLIVDTTKEQTHKLNKLRDTLIELHKANVVKINHSVMEMVCAKYLIQKGYEVKIEYPLTELLTCDLFGTKGSGTLVTEIETGFIPPENAMGPLTYTYARIASKIVRYSRFGSKFALGMPAHYILPLPEPLVMPPRSRSRESIEALKNLCDYYYQDPPITEDGIQNARIHEIYIIDVDRTIIQVLEPEIYIERALKAGSLFTLNTEEIINQPKTPITKPPTQTLDMYLK